MAAKPIPPTPSQSTSAQPAPTKSATPAPAKDVQINRKRLSRFIAQPEDIEFLPTERDEGDDMPHPVAAPAEQASKKPKE